MKTMRMIFPNDAEGRRALRTAMKGRKVIVDEMPYTQREVLKLLTDGVRLHQVWADATGLKLGILWEEWEEG